MRRSILATVVSVGLSLSLTVPAVQAMPTGRADSSKPVSWLPVGGTGNATARVAAKKSSVSLRVPKSPRAGKPFPLRGAAPKNTRVIVQARKPAMKWRKAGSAKASGRGLWRMKLRLGPGAWDLRVMAGSKYATTQVAVAGRKQRVVLRKGTEQLRGSQIKTVSGDPATSQIVTFETKSALPQVGDVVVADISKSAPQGLLGRVSSVDKADLTAVLKPVALDQAYRTYKVFVAAPVGRLAPRDAGLSAALAGAPLTLKCTKVSRSAVPQFTSDLDLSSLRASFDMDLANRYLSLIVTGNPSLEAKVKWEAALKAGCKVQVSAPSIPLGPTGLTLDLSPGIEATLEANGGVTLGQKASARLAVGFVAYKNNVTNIRGASMTVGAPELSASAKASLEISLTNEVALMVAGRAGVFGSLGPVLGAELSADTHQGVCFDVTGGLQVTLGVKANFFVTDWRVELAKGKVTLGHLLKKCWPKGQLPQGPPPPGMPDPSPPAPPPSGFRIARTSGPAGFGTWLGVPPCASGQDGLVPVLATRYPDGEIKGLRFNGGRPLTEDMLATTTETPPGTYRYTIECRLTERSTYESRENPWWNTVESWQLVAAYPVDLTVTGPALRFDADVTVASPGQAIRISDGGGCGPHSKWSVAHWHLYATDDTSTNQPQADVPLSSDGRWGPVTIVLPTRPISPDAHYVIGVTCLAYGNGWPEASEIRYMSLNIAPQSG